MHECCHTTDGAQCSRDGEWEVRGLGPDPYDMFYACGAHVVPLLSTAVDNGVRYVAQPECTCPLHGGAQ